MIRESAAIDDPLLLDVSRVGLLYTGMATLTADPFSKLERNIVRLRLEYEALPWVRDVRGAYSISA